MQMIWTDSEVCFRFSFKDATKIRLEVIKTLVQQLFFLSDVRQNLSQCLVPAVLTQFCPQGNVRKFFMISLTGLKQASGLLQQHKGKITSGIAKIVRQLMTTNTQHTCHTSLETMPSVTEVMTDSYRCDLVSIMCTV